MQTIEQVIANLTLADATEYANTTDKWCFVQGSFTLPNGLKNKCIDAIETALEALLAN